MNEFVPRGYLTVEQAIEHFGRRKYGAEWETEIDSIKLELQQLSFEETLSPKLFTKDGVFYPLPLRIWGSSEVERIWSTGRSSVSAGPEYFEYVVYGRVLFEQATIDALLDGESDDPAPKSDGKPLSKGPDDSQPVASEAECKRWVEELAEKADRLMTKPEVWDLVKVQFEGRISRRRFENQIWPVSVPKEWRKPGPKSKTRAPRTKQNG